MISNSMKKAAPETPSIQSLDRGLTILEAVARSNEPVPLAHLRQILGINRSSVFRLANTLRRRGFLTNPNGRNDYVVGPSIWRLFRNYDWSILVSYCKHNLRMLASQTGETTHLGVREGRQVLFIDHQSSSNQVIAVTGRTGEHMPLYCTAHGKALLADCDAEELKNILGDEVFVRHTKRTVASIDQLAKACAKIKTQGYSVDETEYLEEVRCVAAPIRDKEGMIVAAIGVSAPVTRLSATKLPSTVRYVSEAAKQISQSLSSEG